MRLINVAIISKMIGRRKERKTPQGSVYEAAPEKDFGTCFACATVGQLDFSEVNRLLTLKSGIRLDFAAVMATATDIAVSFAPLRSTRGGALVPKLPLSLLTGPWAA